MSMMNRKFNSLNEYQGRIKRILCVCSAGLLRSPTAAEVLSRSPFKFNTRAAGMNKDFALIIVDEVLLEWANEIVCMTKDQTEEIKNILKGRTDKKVINLNIDDNFSFRDPKLKRLIKKNYLKEISNEKS